MILSLLPENHQRQIQSRLLCRSPSDGLSLCHSHWFLKLYPIHRPYMLLHCPWLPSKSGNSSLCNWKLWPFFTSLHSLYCIVWSVWSNPCSSSLCALRLKCSPAHFPDIWLHLRIHWICPWHRPKSHVTITTTLCPFCVISSLAQQKLFGLGRLCLRVWVEPSQDPVLPLSIPLLSLCTITTAAINITHSLSIRPWLFLPSQTLFLVRTTTPCCVHPVWGAWQLGLSWAGDRMACGALQERRGLSLNTAIKYHWLTTFHKTRLWRM